MSFKACKIIPSHTDGGQKPSWQEKELTGRRPDRKTSEKKRQEDNKISKQHGRKKAWQVVNLTGRQHDIKTSLQKNNLKRRQTHGTKTYNKTTSEDNLTGS